MTIEGWVVIGILFLIVSVGFFTRLRIAKDHREERAVEGGANRQALNSLTKAILAANNQTNLFQVERVNSIDTGEIGSKKNFNGPVSSEGDFVGGDKS